MQATRILPEEYALKGVFDINNTRLALLLNGVGLVLLFGFGWLFMRGGAWLSEPFEMMSLGQFIGMFTWWGLLLVLLVVVLLHELSHGLFFWLFTGERPSLGLGLGYAYAAAPGWYFPRNQFLIIGLAPLALLSGLGLGLMPFVGETAVATLVLFTTLNSAGAVGDLYVCGWLLGKSPRVLVRDKGPVIQMFCPITDISPPTASD